MEKQGALVRQGSPLPSSRGAGSREMEEFSRKRPTGAMGLLGEGSSPSGEQHDLALCFSPTQLDEQNGTDH